jgi:hypothetical protein
MLQYGGRVKLPWHLFSDGSVYVSSSALCPFFDGTIVIILIAAILLFLL